MTGAGTPVRCVAGHGSPTRPGWAARDSIDERSDRSRPHACRRLYLDVEIFDNVLPSEVSSHRSTYPWGAGAMTTATRTLTTRQLGSTDLELTTVGFGAWAIGGGGWAYGWGPQDDDASVAASLHAVDRGV